MSNQPDARVAASVRARLRNLAERGEEFSRVLERYAIERLLFRLASSPYRDRFVLKGAALFMAWSRSPHRPTRDIDLLGFGANDLDTLAATMRAIATLPVVDDGLAFPVEAIQCSPIKVGQRYEGVRVVMLALLERTRVRLQIDVGFGDTMVPPAEEGTFAPLLDLPAPVLKLYPRETVLAEKLHAVVELGTFNTRLKDFYDFWALAHGFDFDGELLGRALAATFNKRATPLPLEPPTGLQPAFAADPLKQQQWMAFLRKSGLAPLDLATDVLPIARALLLPPAHAAARGESFTARWPRGGPWQPR